jgi:aminocarboxymuconate-semialdehyde decarboxylase
MDVELRHRRRWMSAGIDFQVLSPNPLTYFHFVDAPSAVGYLPPPQRRARRAWSRAHPDRLAGLAALPMQSPAAAADR